MSFPQKTSPPQAWGERQLGFMVTLDAAPKLPPQPHGPCLNVHIIKRKVRKKHSALSVIQLKSNSPLPSTSQHRRESGSAPLTAQNPSPQRFQTKRQQTQAALRAVTWGEQSRGLPSLWRVSCSPPGASPSFFPPHSILCRRSSFTGDLAETLVKISKKSILNVDKTLRKRP